MKRTTQQSNQLHAIIGKIRVSKEVKADLVSAFSNGRTRSSADLTKDECDRLINHLNAMQLRPQSIPQVRVNAYSDDPADKLRKKFLSVAHELAWEIEDGSLDWDRINGWLLKFGYMHQPLNNYTYEELPRLITQLENVLKSRYDHSGRI